MVQLISTDIVGLISLVASVLVVLYLIGYSIMLYHAYRTKTIRPDWKISLIFYLGIGVLAIGYIITMLQFCVGIVCSETGFNYAYLLALILFAYGFEKRAGTTVALETKTASKKNKK